MNRPGVIKVRLLRNGKIIRSYKVRSDIFTIGSEKGCSIRAAGDKSLHSKHASVYVENGELTLVPEPDAVVLLNGEQVDFAMIRPNDIIQAGKLTFSVELAEKWDSIPPLETEASPAPMGLESKSPSTPARRPRRRRSSLPPAPSGLAGAEILPSPDAVGPPPWFPGFSKTPSFSKTPTVPDPAPETPEPIGSLVDTNVNTSEIVSEEYLDPGSRKSASRESASRKSASRESANSPYTAGEPWVGSQADPDPNYYFYDENNIEGGDFREPFDLASDILQKQLEIPEGPREPYCAAHIIRFVEGKVAETFGVLPGRPYVSVTGELRCRIRSKKLNMRVDTGLSGDIWREGTRQKISSIPVKRRKHFADLGQGDWVLLNGEEGIYKIEVYRPVLAPKAHRIQADRGFFMIILFALVFHLVVGGVVGLLRPSKLKLDQESEEEVFAEVKLDTPEFKKPELEPPPMPKKVKRDSVSMAEKAPKVSRRTIKRIRDRAKEPARNKSVGSLLKVLSKGSGKSGASDNLKDLVSNIDAVATKGRSGSPFQIAGAIASLPGAGVNIARKGGGGVISTLSGDDVAGQGSSVGKLARGKRGKVRGKVTKMSSGAKVRGSLSRAEVSRVVNSHIHAIQACYERALINSPGMSGRIVFDWVVTKSGRVKGVRVRSSTLGSRKVASCINSLIKRWKFPRPKGGDVTITYPFLFRSVQS